MNKVKSNALWNELSVEQRATLDKWLVEEKLSYTVAWERAKKEMGYKGSRASLHRYFARRAKEREVVNFTALRDEVVAVSAAPGDAASFREASMKVLGQFLFQQVRNAPDKVKEWAPVADLMVRNEYNEIVREAKAWEHQIREQAMAFAKEKFELDMTEQALKALPDLLNLAQARRNPEPDAYAENALLNRARRNMFGVVWEVRPESPEEEAEMLAAKREREARHKAEHEAAAERKPEERITEPQPPTPGSPYYQEYLEWKAKRESKRPESETACQPSPAQPAAVPEAEPPEQEKLPEQQEVERTERKKQREAEAQARLEEMREVCGWQEMQRPPGMEGERNDE